MSEQAYAQYQQFLPQQGYYKAGESQEHPLARIDFCSEFLEKKCTNSSCKKRHIFYKQLRRELKSIHQPYKKHLCKPFENGSKCSKPKYTCLFAHGENDIWNSQFQESKAYPDEINSKQLDDRRKGKKQEEEKKQVKQNTKEHKQETNQGETKQKVHPQEKKQNGDEGYIRDNQRSKNKNFKENEINERKSKRTNGKPISEKDCMNEEEFKQYLESLQNLQKDSSSDDFQDVEEVDFEEEEEIEKEQKKKPKTIIKKEKKENEFEGKLRIPNGEKNKNEEKMKKEGIDPPKQQLNTIPKQNNSSQNQQKKKVENIDNAKIDYQNVKLIDWNNLNPDNLTNEELMKLNAACLNQISSSSESCSSMSDSDQEEKFVKPSKHNLNKEKQHKKKKEDTESKKEKKNFKKNAVENGPIQSEQKKEIIMKDNQVSDEMDIFAFCYFDEEKYLQNWQKEVLTVFFDLNIPKNLLLVQEEDKCNGEFGILLRIRSLRVICLQLLRNNLIKKPNLKILFKLLPNPDCQIVFSKHIKLVKRINEYSFLDQEGQQCIVYNSKIENPESENLEFKNYDFRNINENTRKLEEVITGMLNREEFQNEEFYEKEALSGRIFLGIKDSTRQFIGSSTANKLHESFFTFLAKRLRDCQPSIGSSQYNREEFRLVINGESENEFYPLLDMKIFVLNILKPIKNTIYQSSAGLYFQKIEEGNWPMSACLLYEKKQKNFISEEKFKFALKQLDRRYFYVMAKMANQNALFDQEYNSQIS